MLRAGSGAQWLLGLVGLSFATSCIIVHSKVGGNRPSNYLLMGRIEKEGRKPCQCTLELHSSSGPLFTGRPDPAHGSYRQILTYSEAHSLTEFHIRDVDSITHILHFDQSLLKDSVITLNFRLPTLPRPYRIVVGSSEHSPTLTYDTIWMDPKGKSVTKALSDSLWRRIPLRNRERK